MNPKPDPKAFIEQLDPQEIRTIQFIIGGLMLGAVFFFMVILLLLFTGQPPAAPEDKSLIDFLTILTVLIAIAAISVSGVMFRKILRNSKETGVNPIAAIRQAYLVRFAILEGATFLGLVSLILGVVEGHLPADTIYWMNLFPFILMAFYTFAEFPSTSNIENIYAEYLY